MTTKTDQRAADRVLNKAVQIARARLALCRTGGDYDDALVRTSLANAERFSTAIAAAALLVEEPAYQEGTTAC